MSPSYGEWWSNSEPSNVPRRVPDWKHWAPAALDRLTQLLDSESATVQLQAVRAVLSASGIT